jgi:hypothetical protein
MEQEEKQEKQIWKSKNDKLRAEQRREIHLRRSPVTAHLMGHLQFWQFKICGSLQFNLFAL